MSLPTIKTYDVDTLFISLFWKASPKSSIRSWNLYGSSSVPIDLNAEKGIDISGFTLIKSNISNHESPLTPGSVFVQLTREELSLNAEDSYYFLITSVDHNGSESDLEKTNLHATPANDDYYVDEAGEPVNIVYKNFEFDINQTVGWDVDRFLDMIALLGRSAKQLRIQSVSGGDIEIKINSFTSDSITIDDDYSFPFMLSRGELKFTKVWFNKPGTGTAKVRMFVAG